MSTQCLKLSSSSAQGDSMLGLQVSLRLVLLQQRVIQSVNLDLLLQNLALGNHQISWLCC